ncbi:MAG: alpha/beta hydrolase [Lautropia sp.]
MASDSRPGIVDPAIEQEYNLRQRHPEREAVYRRFAEASERYRAGTTHHRNLRYGPGPRCLLDLFPARGSAEPAPSRLLVFIHGGYWRALEKDIFSFIAEPYAARGMAVAMLGYDLAPAVTLPEIVAETESAMRWLAASAASLGIRSDGVVLAGHSAGGHLCGVLAGRTAGELGGLEVAAIVGLSGIYDLHPLLRASMNRDVRMTRADCDGLSPMAFERFCAQRFLLAVGALETLGFKQQTQRFADRLATLGHPSQVAIVPGRTHFDLLDEFADPGSTLFASTLALTAREPVR